MNKNKINALIVVEGQTDIDFVSSFIDADFYKVNGSAISINDIEFIKKISKTKPIIVLTDPDYPGLKIRETINQNVKGCLNAYIEKEKSIKKGKVGVAESTKEEILKALNNLKVFDKENNKGSLTITDLYDLKLIGNYYSKELRDTLCKKLNIGYSNGKKLLFKLNALNYTKDNLKEIIENVK